MPNSDLETTELLKGGKSALSDLPPAVRTEPQSTAALEEEMDDEQLNDTSMILNGNKAITGKAVHSANQASRNMNEVAAQQANQKEHDAEVREQVELMHLAAWNAQTTNVGGVQMTNKEAQDARQHIIDNGDAYADRAIIEGRITADEREEFKRTIQRIKELEDKRGRGTISGDEQQECERLKQTEAGLAAEHEVGQYAMEQRNHVLTTDASAAAAQDTFRSSAPAVVR